MLQLAAAFCTFTQLLLLVCLTLMGLNKICKKIIAKVKSVKQCCCLPVCSHRLLLLAVEIQGREGGELKNNKALL